MNVRQIKSLSWLGALGLGGLLGWTLFGFIQEKDTLAKGVSQEEQLALLEAVKPPPPPKREAVSYEVVKMAFQKMNWAGTPPVIEEEGPDITEGTTEPEYRPMAELLQVQYLQVDRTGDRSLAWVKFLDADLIAAASKAEDRILTIGESLASPWESISVKAISPGGVTFTFAGQEGGGGDGGEARPDETLAASSFERSTSGIVKVGENGVLSPNRGESIGRIDPTDFNPRVLTATGSGEYAMGWDTAAEIEQNYTQILTSDLSYQSYRDPRTRKISGIEVTRVANGSIPAQAGLQEGEILKSINGHAVTSVSDAVNFVKQNADSTDIWVAVFERRGREFTRTYTSPPD